MRAVKNSHLFLRILFSTVDTDNGADIYNVDQI